MRPIAMVAGAGLQPWRSRQEWLAMEQNAAADGAAPGVRPRLARLYHLDALRASMMLMGVFGHAAALDDGSDWFFNGIRGASDLFRMACFFVVAGFFSAMVWLRSDWLGYFRNRLRQLAVPLVAALLLVVPVANWLVWRWHEGPIDFKTFILSGPPYFSAAAMISWHSHMWFLAVLCVYSALVPLLIAVLRLGLVQRMAGWVERQPVVARLWLLAALVGLGQLAMRAAWHGLGLPLLEATPLEFPVKSAFSYLPFFCVGLLAWLRPGIMATLERTAWAPIVAGVVLAGAAYWALSGAAGEKATTLAQLAQAVSWVPRGMLTVFIIAALMRLALYLFQRPSPLLRLGTNMALSFYIFHLPAVYAVALLVQPWLGSTRLVYPLVVLVVPPIMALVHVLLIEPFAPMRLLWTGRTDARTVMEPKQPVLAQ